MRVTKGHFWGLRWTLGITRHQNPDFCLPRNPISSTAKVPPNKLSLPQNGPVRVHIDDKEDSYPHQMRLPTWKLPSLPPPDPRRRNCRMLTEEYALVVLFLCTKRKRQRARKEGLFGKSIEEVYPVWGGVGVVHVPSSGTEVVKLDKNVLNQVQQHHWQMYQQHRQIPYTLPLDKTVLGRQSPKER
jgi:hypothetical protein